MASDDPRTTIGSQLDTVVETEQEVVEAGEVRLDLAMEAVQALGQCMARKRCSP